MYMKEMRMMNDVFVFIVGTFIKNRVQISLCAFSLDILIFKIDEGTACNYLQDSVPSPNFVLQRDHYAIAIEKSMNTAIGQSIVACDISIVVDLHCPAICSARDQSTDIRHHIILVEKGMKRP